MLQRMLSIEYKQKSVTDYFPSVASDETPTVPQPVCTGARGKDYSLRLRNALIIEKKSWFIYYGQKQQRQTQMISVLLSY